MSLQTWEETLANQQAAGTLLATYTTAKSVINPQALVTVPQGYFYIGRTIRVNAIGGLSNVVTTPGTVTMQVMLGTIVAFTTGAMQMNATAHTTVPFWFEAMLTVRAVGGTTTANMMGQARVFCTALTVTAGQVDGVNSMAYLMAPNTAPAVGAGYDSTAAQTIDFWAGFSISNAGNGIQVHQFSVESMT